VGGGGLRRTLGLGSLTFYGVGLILGAGIYSILGEAAGIAGEALWQAFLLGSLAALLTGLSYAELATMFPRAGAEYVYMREAWPGVAWIAGALGWVLVVAGCATTATVALAFAGYTSLFLSLSPWLVAAALVLAAVALNVVGVQEASWVNIAFTLVEAGGLVAVIAAGMRNPHFGEAFRVAPHPGVLGGAALIFFAYLGFEDIANLAEEAKHPARDIPRAIGIAVAVSTLLYVLVASASVTLLDPVRLAQSPSPLADVMRAGAPQLAGAVGGVALFATANTALITVTAASRLVYALARGGDAPPVFGRTLAARQTPAAAIVFAGGCALAFLPLGGVGFVGSVASLLALLAFAVVNAALVRLRFVHPEAARPFRVPLQIGRVPVLAVLALLMVMLLFVQFEAPVYGLAVAALVLALIVQAIPWRGRAASGGQSQRR
jgi:amino acid transporter